MMNWRDKKSMESFGRKPQMEKIIWCLWAYNVKIDLTKRGVRV